MAITELTSQRNTFGAGQLTTVTFTYPGTPTSGNLLVAAFAWRGNVTVSAVPSGWNLAASTADGNNIDGAIYYKIAGSSEPTTAQWTLSGSQKAAGVASEWSGIHATPLDASNGNTGTTSTILSTNATGVLSQASELVINLFSARDTVTFNAFGQNQTTVGTVQSTGGTTASRNTTLLASEVVSSTTSVDYTAQIDSAQTWVAAVATFKSSEITAALTGNNVTAGQGALTDGLSVAISGHSTSAERGTLSAAQDYTASLTGHSVSSGFGSLSQARTVNLTGLDSTLSPGIVTAASEYGLSGQSLDITSGNIAGSVDDVLVALSGHGVSLAAESFGSVISGSIAGHELSIEADNISINNLCVISGHHISAEHDSIIHGSEISIHGSELVSEFGDVSHSSELELTGHDLGGITESLGGTYDFQIEGIQLTTFKGSVGTSIDGAQSVNISGFSLGVSAGTLSFNTRKIIYATYQTHTIAADLPELEISAELKTHTIQATI